MSSAGAQLANTEELAARKMYERLTGTKIPIDAPEIKKMVELIKKNDWAEAAKVATSDPNFLNVTVKLMAAEMSTREETIKTPLNDFVAAVIGVTRDNRDARELLTGNFYYAYPTGASAGIRSDPIADILLSNNHYDDLQANRINLAEKLVRVENQKIATSATTSVDNPDPAGVITSRAFLASHAIMGTNRRLVEYTMREFLCVPMNSWADTSTSDARIGRDIDRFPAGDHTKFQTSCKGCHTGMDGFRGAFAKWDFIGTSARHSAVNPRGSGANFTIDTDTQGIVKKMNKNESVFPSGYVTTDDSFINNARGPANQLLFSWRDAPLGNRGARGFGALVANSPRFGQCMTQRVFSALCKKDFDAIKNSKPATEWAAKFESSGFNLRQLFEDIAIHPLCLGEGQ